VYEKSKKKIERGTMTTYPNPCCRCGYCCLTTTCPIGLTIFGTDRGICPGLSFNKEGTSTCKLAGIVPIGDGCCIKARAFADGLQYDFASLPPNTKQSLAQILKIQRVNNK
jgi:hypothetical protein